jgi:hypothetical protein
MSVIAFRPKGRPATYRDLDRIQRRPGCKYELLEGTIYVTRFTPVEARARDAALRGLLEMIRERL